MNYRHAPALCADLTCYDCGHARTHPLHLALEPRAQLPEVAAEPSGALFSPCRRWRYALWRSWAPELPAVAFLGLNPSTADERADDATIRRCLGYARAWGFGTLYMLNLYAWRSTDPAPMFRQLRTSAAEDPTGGPDHDRHLVRFGGHADRVIAAWGAFTLAQERGRRVVDMLEGRARARVYVLDRTNAGAPRHPLYARKDLEPQPWRSWSPAWADPFTWPDPVTPSPRSTP